MKLSIGMMVKNESKYLDKCLKALEPIRKSIDSELVIVDTGSTDNTVKIAKKYTNKVYFHKWNNDFSEIRNITIRYSSGEWFMCIDADEIIDNVGNIVEFFKSNRDKEYNSASIIVKNITDGNDESNFSAFCAVRLFRNTEEFRFEGAVHNQPISEGPVYSLDTSLLHYGYIIDDKLLMEKKFKRTSSILINELKKEPNNIYYLYQLSVSYSMHKDYEKAMKPMEKAYNLIKDNNELKKEYVYLYSQMSMVYYKNGLNIKMEEICKEGLKVKKDFIDLYYCLGIAQINLEKYNKALENLNIYLKILDEFEKNPNKYYTKFDYYTIGKRDSVNKMKSDIYYILKDYNSAISHIYKIQNKNLIFSSLSVLIRCYIRLNDLNGLKLFLQEKIKKDESLKKGYFMSIFNEINALKIQQQKDILNLFLKEKVFGILANVKLKIIDNNFSVNEDIISDINSLNFNELSYIYGDLIYYLIKCKQDIVGVTSNIREDKLNTFITYIDDKFIDINDVFYKYLKIDFGQDFQHTIINKTLSRRFILGKKINDNKYKKMVYEFLDSGITYLSQVYRKEVLENEQVNLVKDDEDAFLLYMYKANKVKQNNKELYIKYLRKALKECNYMKDLVEFLMDEIKKELDNNYISDEFEKYKVEVKSTIKRLISNNKIDEAESIINEYEDIVKEDIEIVLLKSEIALKKTSDIDGGMQYKM